MAARSKPPSLRVYDACVQMIFARHGTYYCITNAYLRRRAYTALQMRAWLQQYYAMLVWEHSADESTATGRPRS